MYKKLLLVVLASTISLVGCNDPGDDLAPAPPIIPNVQEAQMNTDAMTAPSDPENENMAVYVNAHGTLNDFRTNLGLIYTTIGEMFTAASSANAEYNEDNESFTWSYSTALSVFTPYEDTDDSFDFVLTADVSTPGTVGWKLTFSGTLLGNSLQNIDLLNGTTSEDLQSVNLNIDFGNEELGAIEITFGWEMNDEVLEKLVFNARLYSIATDLDVDVQSTYTFTAPTAELDLNVYNEQVEGYVPFTIRWNVDGNGGYINHPQMGEVCWDANKMNTQCP